MDQLLDFFFYDHLVFHLTYTNNTLFGDQLPDMALELHLLRFNRLDYLPGLSHANRHVVSLLFSNFSTKTKLILYLYNINSIFFLFYLLQIKMVILRQYNRSPDVDVVHYNYRYLTITAIPILDPVFEDEGFDDHIDPNFVLWPREDWN